MRDNAKSLKKSFPSCPQAPCLIGQSKLSVKKKKKDVKSEAPLIFIAHYLIPFKICLRKRTKQAAKVSE